MKWLHNILKGASLTTALFIFQACYGTPNWLHDAEVQFKVVSAVDNTPLKDVSVFTRVSANEAYDWLPCGVTAENGELDAVVGCSDVEDPQFRFQAGDASYAVKDTVVADLSKTIVVKLKKVK